MTSRRSIGRTFCMAVVLAHSLLPITAMPGSAWSCESESGAEPPKPPPIRDLSARFHPVVGEGGMAASQESLATGVGTEILRRGGNAADAAVAMSFALAVTLPRAGNLGGGGFMIVHEAATGKTTAVDYRETAPSAARRDLFLDGEGEHDPALSERGPLSVGVPGSVRGLALVHEVFGSLPWADLVAPAIHLAEEGFPMTREFADSLDAYRDDFERSPAAMAVFFKPDGSSHAPGEMFRQPDLAASLRLIATDGADAFYEGVLADRIVGEMARWNGLVTADDLKAYRPKLREPVRGRYRGLEICSMPPPSAGGALLVQMLATFERLTSRESETGAAPTLPPHHSARHVHLMAEIMRRAYADRAGHFGDPDFVEVPVDRLVSAGRVAELAASIDPTRATPAEEVGDPTLRPARPESPETTHLSVIDAEGNAVSCTTTLNFSYGSRHMVAGTGILLNNEMDDFAAKPGAPNAYGAIGGEANAVAPGKRMLSSMTPVIVLREGCPWLVTGSPGGTRITTTVFQILSNVIDYRMNLAEAVSAPRVHHQWYPDRIELEDGFSPDTTEILRSMGHRVRRSAAIGAVESVVWDGGTLFGGFSDPRRPDGAASPVRP